MRVIRYAAFAALALAVACGGNPKPALVGAYEATEVALGHLQDAERAAYKSGLVPALTKELHEQRISPAFSKAFAAQLALGPDIKAWRAGDALPPHYGNWIAAVDAVADVVGIVAPKDAAVARTASDWARTVITTLAAFNKTAPPQVAALAGGH